MQIYHSFERIEEQKINNFHAKDQSKFQLGLKQKDNFITKKYELRRHCIHSEIKLIN